jgi:hypothetical protein
MPTRFNTWIFIADLIACSTCFGDHYAHHQELESIIQVIAACRIWCLVFKLSVWCGAEGCVSGLRAASSVAPSWHFISTYYRRCRLKPHQIYSFYCLLSLRYCNFLLIKYLTGFRREWLRGKTSLVEGGNFIYDEAKWLYYNWRQILSKTLMVAKFNDHCDLVSRLFSGFQQTEAIFVISLCICPEN